ncbi:MAG: FAD-dependent oxidoreductase, partial [Marinoscillum sp.]
REWSISAKRFIGDENGNLIGLETANAEFDKKTMKFQELKNTSKVWDCDMAILALGFKGPEQNLPQKLNIGLNNRGNIDCNSSYQTKKNNIFIAGDCKRGQSLIVWAISEGREAAYYIDKYLMGTSSLPTKKIEKDL